MEERQMETLMMARIMVSLCLRLKTHMYSGLFRCWSGVKSFTATQLLACTMRLLVRVLSASDQWARSLFTDTAVYHAAIPDHRHYCHCYTTPTLLPLLYHTDTTATVIPHRHYCHYHTVSSASASMITFCQWCHTYSVIRFSLSISVIPVLVSALVTVWPWRR